MSANALKFTTHEGVTKVVPLDTVRLVRPMTDEDKQRAKDGLKEKGIWAQHALRVDRLKADQSAERTQQRGYHYAATRGVTLQMAKASLAADVAPANDRAAGAAQIKHRMAQWRARNQGKDFGRET